MTHAQKMMIVLLPLPTQYAMTQKTSACVEPDGTQTNLQTLHASNVSSTLSVSKTLACMN